LTEKDKVLGREKKGGGGPGGGSGGNQAEGERGEKKLGEGVCGKRSSLHWKVIKTGKHTIRGVAKRRGVPGGRHKRKWIIGTEKQGHRGGDEQSGRGSLG